MTKAEDTHHDWTLPVSGRQAASGRSATFTTAACRPRAGRSTNVPPTGQIRVLTLAGNPDLLQSIAECAGIQLAALARPDHFELLRPAVPAECVTAYQPGTKLQPRAIRLVNQAIRQFRPHIVHTFSSRGLAHALLATTGMRDAPVIVGYRGIIRSPSRWDPANWLTLFHRRTRMIVCVSDAARQSLIRAGMGTDRCRTIRNPLQALPMENHQRRQVRQSWGIPDDAFVIGTVGTMRAVKRVDLVLRTALRMADLKNIYWVLIGQVVDPRVKRLLKEPLIQPRLRVLGHRPDARWLIGAADIYALASRMEGLNRSMLEAMSVGVCPVVTDVGGNAEVVRHAQDGFLVPYGNLDALEYHLRRLEADRPLLRSIGNAARRKIGTWFARDRCAAQFAALYHELLARVGR